MGAKETRIGIRVSQSELHAIKLKAKRAGLTSSEYIRRVAMQETNRPIVQTDIELLRSIYSNLRHVGANLNQCARELNTRHKPNQIENELMIAFAATSKATEDVSNFINEIKDCI